MAPKKTVLLLAALLAVSTFTAATSIDMAEDQVWLNDQSEIQFNVTFNEECTEGEEVTVERPDGVTELNVEEDQEEFIFDSFDESGTYTIQASCIEEDIEHEDPYSFEAGVLELELNEVPTDTIYEGDSFEAEIVLEKDNQEMNLPEAEYEYNLNGEWNSLEVEDDVFEVTVESEETDSLEVRADTGEFILEESEELDVQPVWQIENLDITAEDSISDDTVKYRYLDQLQLDFTVTERGEGVEGLRTNEFLFDSEDDWFEKEDRGNGDYTLTFDSEPIYIEEELTPPGNVEVLVELENRLEIINLKVEKDHEFSGRILNERDNRVETEFRFTYDSRRNVFSTNDQGFFSAFVNQDTVDANIIFNENSGVAEAEVNLKSMKVDRDSDHIRYSYFSDVEENTDTSDFPNIRPVNLVSFNIPYYFEESVDSWVNVEFDSSGIVPEEIQVYECNTWDSGSCSGDWRIISEDDVDLNPPGRDWRAEFPITPRTSDRFGHDEGVMTNAYLVGVPEGVGSGLTLDSSLDVSNSRISSGEELTVSGRIIDDTTGDSVEDVDVEIELVSEDNRFSVDGRTDENGNFELETGIDEAGDYDVEFSAVKSPYDSFEESQSEAIEVYYETGLTISSESNPEVGLGEDYDIEYTIENVGQALVEDIEMSVSGVDNGESSLNPDSISDIEPGDSETVVLTVNLDEDLRTPPSITFEASGSSTGEEVSQSSSTLLSLADDSTQEEEGSTTESSSTDEDSGESSSYSIPNGDEVQQMTGEFIESQSQMNLALGLILVFAAVLAVAVKNKNNDSGRDRRGRSQSRVQAPQVAPTEEYEEELEKEESGESSEESVNSSSEEESSSDTGEDGEVACDVCGETFDTESGMNLHKQALH